MTLTMLKHDSIGAGELLFNGNTSNLLINTVRAATHFSQTEIELFFFRLYQVTAFSFTPAFE